MTTQLIAYTDGACKGNGQKGTSAGGYGVHIIYPNGDVLNIWGGDNNTTNNRMELQAAIVALERTPTDVSLQIWTDSSYVKNGVTKWLSGWKQKNWRKADGKPVLNLELWQKLDTLSQKRVIDWQWVKGHAGHAGNEKADMLANLGVSEQGEQFIQNQSSPTNQHAQNDPEVLALISDTQYFENLAQLADNDDESIMTFEPTINQSIQKPDSTPKKHTALQRHCQQNPDYDGDTSGVNPNFWAVLPDPINQGKSERQLIMDTETTGFEDQKGDRIVEIGIIELIGRKPTGQQLHVYLNPDKIMDDEVIRVHGISNDFLLDKPRFADVAQYVYDFMKGAEVIAHNATFDMRFLKMEFDRVGLTDFSEQVHVIDSLALARQLYPGQKNSLDMLVRRLGVGQKDRTFHGALLDSEILAEVYLAMTGGQIALAIEEEKDESTQEQTLTFFDLSKYADTLIKSKADIDADQAWRALILKN